MSSRLLVNLIDPSEIVVPDTDGVPDAGAPDTGVLSIGKWLDEAFNNNTALFIAIGLIVLVVAVIIVLLIRRRKKQSSINGFGGYAPMKLGAQKYLVPKLAGLSFVVLVSVFGILKFYDGQRMVNAEAADGSTLTITTEEVTAIDIEMTDEAVFGVGESKVKVTTATDTGYTLMAYVDSTTTDLTNGSGDKIAMLETSQSQALTDNTWGISLSKPDSQDKTLFRGLPTAEKDAMVVKVSGSDATEANDETTLYYAAYVTPDLSYGTYEGVTINYIAVAHVTDGDVTVNFHGNGYYFDEAGTKDVNTMTFGNICNMIYVGGNCARVYTTEQPYTIVKTPNINDDGTQNGSYPIDWNEPIVYQSVSIPGADAIKIEVDYAISAQQSSVYLNVARGVLDYDDFQYDAEIYTSYGDYTAGEETFVFDSDAVTILFRANSEPIEDYDYGFYARIYPIYYEQPDGVNSIEDTLCYIVKSKNINDDGNATGLYEYENWITKPITIPGATQIKVEIDYALTEEAEIEIVEGYEYGDWNSWEDLYADGENLSGTEEYVFNGDTVTFEYGFWDEPLEDYGYGFFARLYPVYDEEQDGTTTAQTCSSFGRKSGEYSLPVGYTAHDGDSAWYAVIEDGDRLGFFPLPPIDGTEYDLLKSGVSILGNNIDIYLINPYTMVFDANGGSGYMEEQSILPHTNIEVISGNYFIRENYEFVGWNTRADGSGTWYYPGGAALDLAQPGETITLYAQWEIDMGCNPEATTINNAVCMQDFAGPNSEQIVSSMTPETQYTLVDGRDGKSYTITKLLVGDEFEVWMTQNLDLNIDSNKTYTNGNTDIGYNTDTQQYGIATWKPVRSTYSTDNNAWGDSGYTPESYDPGDLCWNGEIAPDSYGTLNDYTMACSSEKHYHIGNYYNLTAALAMNDSSSYTVNYTDVNQSICPVGWRLPVLKGSKSYKSLITEYSLTGGASGNIQNAPLYFVYAGGWRRGVGGWGAYWPSSIHSDTGAWAFEFSRDESVSFGIEFYRYAGNSVRCVARTSEIGPSISISDLTYMQDFATLTSGEKSEVLASMTEGRQYQLKDNRDEKTYYISKLADGNVWMTQNLDHDIVTTENFYTYANTDIGHGSTPNMSATWTASVATHITDDTTWTSSVTTPQSYDPGNLCWDGVFGNNTIATGTTTCGDDKHMHIGNYYNWTAAVAMNDSSSYVVDQTDVDQSICPSGWRLPTYSDDKSYVRLFSKISLSSGESGNIQNSPVFFVYGGSGGGMSYYVGSVGYYWTSVAKDDTLSYDFNFNRYGYIFSRNDQGRSGGSSVRCVAR